jgi:hypothetical protein
VDSIALLPVGWRLIGYTPERKKNSTRARKGTRKRWQVHGPRDFLLVYAAGLAEQAYRRCALEAMAFDHQGRFDAGDPPYSVEAEVWRQTLALKATV